MAIVLHQADAIAVDHGDQGHCTSVNDDLALGDRSVGQRYRLEGQVDLPAAIDHAARRRRGSGRHGDAAPQSVAGRERSGVAESEHGTGRLADDPLGDRTEQDVARARFVRAWR